MNDWMRRLRGLNRAAISEGGGYHCEGGLLAGKDHEEPLQHHDAAEVECDQRGRQRAVDEGAVYEDVYIEQVRA